MWDANVQLDFDKDEFRFFNLLAQKADHNIIVQIEDIKSLKKEMKTQGIPVKRFDELCTKMEQYQILKNMYMGASIVINLSSAQVATVQAVLEKNTCPDCNECTLKDKIVIHCPECGHQHDKS